MGKKDVFQKIVEESIVLLKNEEDALPLKEGKWAAFLGRAQTAPFFSGNGSGASAAVEDKDILTTCEKRGIHAEPGLKAYYDKMERKEKQEVSPDWDVAEKAVETGNSGFMYELFGRYQAPREEFEVPDALLEQAGRHTNTALLILGRNSGGEECDRRPDSDFFLTDSEKALVRQSCRWFKKVILILNCNGLIDLGWLEGYSAIKSVLFWGIPGEEGCVALANILVGRVNPSGKLPVTVARRLEDYPSSAHFSWDKEQPERILTYGHYGLEAEKNGSMGYAKSPVTVYQEDIYIGYRYFDTFHKNVLFPFGFGLSYTSFEVRPIVLEQSDKGAEITVEVENSGNKPGKEVVQVYLSCSETASERPLQELKGFEKTRLLRPGEKEQIHIFIPRRELACYVEEWAAYVVEKGKYRFYAGSSSRNTSFAGEVCVEEDVVVQQCANRLGIRECNRNKINFLSQNAASKAVFKSHKSGMLRNAAQMEIDFQKEVDSQKDAVRRETDCDCEVNGLSVRELAALCVGYGPGTPFASLVGGNALKTICDEQQKPLTTNSHPVGFDGYVSPAMADKGIYSIFYKDGPAGIGTGAWPTEMLIACAFHKELWQQFGDAVGAECEKMKVDVWLAPAVNLHRNPLCGRNFEYFSEDPYLTGICACRIAQGVQTKHPVMVCPKHFALNEQETYRRGSAKNNYDAIDSIVRERTAREIYLKPFEMLVRDAGVSCIMTSFNKINGVFAGGNRDLCTYILRNEWGFEGIVITDWGDMDIVVDGADAVMAGNDIVMPGGPPVIHQILKGYQEKRLDRAALERAVLNLLKTAAKIRERGSCDEKRD